MDDTNDTEPIVKVTMAEQKLIDEETSRYGKGQSPIQTFEGMYGTGSYQEGLRDKHDAKARTAVPTGMPESFTSSTAPNQTPGPTIPETEEKTEGFWSKAKEGFNSVFRPKMDDIPDPEEQEEITPETTVEPEVKQEEPKVETPVKEDVGGATEPEGGKEENTPVDDAEKARRAEMETRLQELDEQDLEEQRTMDNLRQWQKTGQTVDAVIASLGMVNAGLGALGNGIDMVRDMTEMMLSGRPLSMGSRAITEALTTGDRLHRGVEAAHRQYDISQEADRKIVANTVKGRLMNDRMRTMIQGDDRAMSAIADILRKNAGGRTLDNLNDDDVENVLKLCRDQRTKVMPRHRELQQHKRMGTITEQETRELQGLTAEVGRYTDVERNLKDSFAKVKERQRAKDQAEKERLSQERTADMTAGMGDATNDINTMLGGYKVADIGNLADDDVGDVMARIRESREKLEPRYRELREKSKAGTLTPDEVREMNRTGATIDHYRNTEKGLLSRQRKVAQTEREAQELLRQGGYRRGMTDARTEIANRLGTMFGKTDEQSVADSDLERMSNMLKSELAKTDRDLQQYKAQYKGGDISDQTVWNMNWLQARQDYLKAMDRSVTNRIKQRDGAMRQAMMQYNMNLDDNATDYQKEFYNLLANNRDGSRNYNSSAFDAQLDEYGIPSDTPSLRKLSLAVSDRLASGDLSPEHRAMLEDMQDRILDAVLDRDEDDLGMFDTRGRQSIADRIGARMRDRFGGMLDPDSDLNSYDWTTDLTPEMMGSLSDDERQRTLNDHRRLMGMYNFDQNRQLLGNLSKYLTAAGRSSEFPAFRQMTESLLEEDADTRRSDIVRPGEGSWAPMRDVLGMMVSRNATNKRDAAQKIINSNRDNDRLPRDLLSMTDEDLWNTYGGQGMDDVIPDWIAARDKELIARRELENLNPAVLMDIARRFKDPIDRRAALNNHYRMIRQMFGLD